jgi:FkbM family methyltransferase
MKVWIRGALAGLGIEIAAYTGSFAQHRARLVYRGGISTVWDVGAHVGQFGARLITNGYRGRIVSIEPGHDSFTDLSRRASRHRQWTAVEMAISDSAGPVTLNLSANGQSSSLLPMNDLHVAADPNSRYVGRQAVQSTTLDRLQAELTADPPFYVKLDVQGGELAALRGAPTVLSDTIACEVELSLADLYLGQSSWKEVIEFLSAAGFVICDFERVFADAASGDLLQLNALLRRDPPAASRR